LYRTNIATGDFLLDGSYIYSLSKDGEKNALFGSFLDRSDNITTPVSVSFLETQNIGVFNVERNLENFPLFNFDFKVLPSGPLMSTLLEQYK
jgi:hypothetical protein